MDDSLVPWLVRAIFVLVLSFSVAPTADVATAYLDLTERTTEGVAGYDADRPGDEPGEGARSCQGPGSCWALLRAPAVSFLLRPPQRFVASISSDILTEWILPPLDRPPRSAA